MTTDSPAFRRALGWRRRWWQTGLLLRAALRLAGWALILLLAAGLLDFFLALEARPRVALDAALALTLAGLFLKWVVDVVRLSSRDMAERADRLLGDRRRRVLGALELDRWLRGRAAVPDDLSGYLARRSIAETGERLRGLRFRAAFPFREVGAQLRLFLLQATLAGAVVACYPDAALTVLLRLAFPNRDVPPYSVYTFSVAPSRPNVVYGGTVAVAVEIRGAPVSPPVWFVTRYLGQTVQTACFQESPERFAQRLDKVVNPVEFCFATGKARSPWHRVNVLLQPQIAVASVVLTPPAYSRLPARQFFVGNEELAGLRGSRVELTVTSNRPLLDGLLALRPRSGLGADQAVPGERAGAQSVVFRWTIEEPAALEVTVRDVQGTRSRDPFRIQQAVTPDKPPEASITRPAGFTLATPKAAMELEGCATDDLGLRGVALARSVVGYRDRLRPIGPQAGERRAEFSQTLDLHVLGVEPGQVLEFFVEASDLNPTLMGVAASEVVRIQIISEEDYAAMLRARTTLEEFLQRFRAMDAQVEGLKQAIRDLADSARSGKAAPEELRAKLEKARTRNREVGDLFRRLAEDFPVYDIEKGLVDSLREMATVLKDNDERMEGMQPPYNGLAEVADIMLREMGEPEQKMESAVRSSEETALLARVMECAARFRALVARQSDLVRRLERFAKEPRSSDLRLLGSLGLQQEEVRTNLVALAADLTARAGELPNTYRTLRASAEEFAGLIARHGIPDLMARSVTAAANQDGEPAHRHAALALEKLEQLMKDTAGSEFGAMCQGELKFEVPKDLKSTLQQMMRSIGMRFGVSGEGWGRAPGVGGAGMVGSGMMGGDQNDGFWMGGYSPLNVPMSGPSRTSVPGGSGPGVAGQGRDAAGAGRGRVETGAAERMTGAEQAPAASESLPLDEVPEKYRDAVKRFFGEETSHEAE